MTRAGFQRIDVETRPSLFMKRNDILWKSILEDTFDDFLRFFFPDADELFDFDLGFEYLDKELEQLFPPEKDRYAPKYVDKLVKVFTNEGSEEWILVHIEVQGYADKFFADRMFTYYYRIWDKYRRRTIAFAILTDENESFRPCKFEHSFLGTALTYQFNTFKVLDQSDQCLAESNNPFSQVILTVKAALSGKKLGEEDLLSLKIQLARRLLSRNIPKAKIGKLMIFLKFYVRLGKEELDEKFDSEIDTLTHNDKTTMGIEEYLLYDAEMTGLEKGIEKGREEKNTSFTKKLLQETSFPPEEIARLVDVPLEFVMEIKEKL